MGDQKVRFGDRTYAALHHALRQAFPDSKLQSADVEALAVCVYRSQCAGEALPPELGDLDLSAYAAQLTQLASRLNLPEQAVPGAVGTEDAFRYYWVEAEHTRAQPAGFEPFTGELAMVRVTLPARVPKTFKTRVGVVAPSDHLVDTLLEANSKYARFLEAPMERLDLITPGRQGARFGAISVLLGYRSPRASTPYCYILEGGTATGQPKVLYLGRTLDTTINAYTGYQPTPFACPSHAYTGRLSLDGDEPRELTITSRKIENQTSRSPYIRIRARFRRQVGTIANIWPGFLIARAASIVLFRDLRGVIEKDCNPTPPGGES